MSQKEKWHGKLCGAHTRAIKAAWRFLPKLIQADEVLVSRISPGHISAHKSSRGRVSVKIIDDKGGILLLVSGGSEHQEIRVFSKDVIKAKEFIARAALNSGANISFNSRV